MSGLVRSTIHVPDERSSDAGYEAPSNGTPVDVASRMARWRLRLFAWLAAHEAPEAGALGLPPERVVTVDEPVRAGAGCFEARPAALRVLAGRLRAKVGPNG